MAEMKDQKLAAAEAEERMKLIAPLLTPGLSRETLAEMKHQICEEYRISERTLRRYLQLYREDGFERLKPRGHEAGENTKSRRKFLRKQSVSVVNSRTAVFPPSFRFWNWKALFRKTF